MITQWSANRAGNSSIAFARPSCERRSMPCNDMTDLRKNHSSVNGIAVAYMRTNTIAASSGTPSARRQRSSVDQAADLAAARTRARALRSDEMSSAQRARVISLASPSEVRAREISVASPSALRAREISVAFPSAQRACETPMDPLLRFVKASLAHVMSPWTRFLGAAVDPGRILHTAFGFRYSNVLLTAIAIGAFTQLGARQMTGAELGREIEIPRAPSRMPSMRSRRWSVIHFAGASSAAVAYESRLDPVRRAFGRAGTALPRLSRSTRRGLPMK